MTGGRSRSRIAALGIVLALLGLGIVLVPEAARELGFPRLGVVLLGVLALVQAARSLAARARTDIAGAEMPDPEAAQVTPVPGDGFDEQVAELARARAPRLTVGRVERLRRRLRAAAVDAATHRWRLTPEIARERVAAGEWTDDAVAAWFLGDPRVPRPPWAVRARAAIARPPAVAYYANRTAEAIVDLREGP